MHARTNLPIRSITGLLAICLFLFALGSYGICDDPKGREDVGLVGTWEVVSRHYSGNVRDTQAFRRVIFREDGVLIAPYALRPDGEDIEHKYALDDSKSPRHIEWGWKLGNGSTYRTRGIYKIEGDVLTICSTVGREPNLPPRPHKFETHPDDKQFLKVFSRRRAPKEQNRERGTE
jgi:uncharacterized protein (TIGR03067 family)